MDQAIFIIIINIFSVVIINSSYSLSNFAAVTKNN